MARSNQDADQPKPERKRHTKPSRPRDGFPLPCLTLWFEDADWRITHSISVGNIAWDTAYTGKLLHDVWPAAHAFLQPLLQRVRASGLPCACAIPPLAPAFPFTWFTGVSLPALAKSVATVICTLVTGPPLAVASIAAEVERLETTLAGDVTLVEGARQLVEVAQEMMHSDTCQVVLANSSYPHELRCVAVAGVAQGLAEGRVLSEQSLVSRIMAENHTLNLIADQFTDAIHDVWIKELVQHYQGQAFIGVPLQREGQPFGVLMAQRLGQTQPFSTAEQQQLETLCAHIGPMLGRLHAREFEVRNLRLQRLIEHLPVGVLWTDGHGQVLYSNERQTQISRYVVGDVIAPFSAELHPFLCRPFTFEPVRWDELPISRTIQTGEPTEMTLLVRGEAPEQVERVILVKTQRMHDAQGLLTDVIAVQVDITAQYLAEQMARDRATELDAIIESITDGVVIYDLGGHILRYNQAAVMLTNMMQGAARTTDDSDEQPLTITTLLTTDGTVIPPEAWPSKRALNGEIVKDIALAFVVPDGKRMVMSADAAPLRDPITSDIRGAVLVFRDITERHNLDKMKDDFMGIASHELRTPLTSLVLASRLLQKWLGRPEKTNDLAKLGEDIVTQVKRLGMLIDNILDLTRITGAHFVLTITQTNLASAIRTAVDEQQHISKRPITIHGLAEPIMGKADARRITQVVANLLANALKYSPQTAPVEITSSIPNGDDAWLQIAVRDYGAGIAPERLADVFERRGDVQVDSTVPIEQQVRGLGLGLFIARAIVEAHGGRIWATSELGAGSTFSFIIPRFGPSTQEQNHG